MEDVDRCEIRCIVCDINLAPWREFGAAHLDTPDGPMCFNHLFDDIQGDNDD